MMSKRSYVANLASNGQITLRNQYPLKTIGKGGIYTFYCINTSFAAFQSYLYFFEFLLCI